MNGGFEEPVVKQGGYQLVAVGQRFPGWRVIGASRGNVAPISGAYRSGRLAFNARSGAQWLDMTGLSNTTAGVEQTVRTEPGAAYELSFHLGNVVGGGFGKTSAIEVLVDGKSAGVFHNDASVPGAQHWRRIALRFTAAGSSSTLAFVNRDAASDNSCGLDEVALARVSAGAATVLPDGSIEQSQSEDPIRSNLRTAVLTRRP